MMDNRRKEILPRQEHPEPKLPPVEPELKKENILGKRPADQQLLEGASEPKKLCTSEPPLEDDLSEISDDADEILNRDEVIKINNNYF